MSAITTFITSRKTALSAVWRTFHSAPEHLWKGVLILLFLIGMSILASDAYVFLKYVRGIDQLVLDPQVEVACKRATSRRS